MTKAIFGTISGMSVFSANNNCCCATPCELCETFQTTFPPPFLNKTQVTFPTITGPTDCSACTGSHNLVRSGSAICSSQKSVGVNFLLSAGVGMAGLQVAILGGGLSTDGLIYRTFDYNCCNSSYTIPKAVDNGYCSGFPETITLVVVPYNHQFSLNTSGVVLAFTLTFAGQTTSPLGGVSTAAQIQAALESLSTIGSGNVSCTGGPLGTAAVVIEFVGGLSSMAVPQLTGTVTTGTGSLVIVKIVQGTPYCYPP